MVSTTLLLLCSALVSCCLAGWQNYWDRHHFGSCDDGGYIRRIKSIHDNSKEDRRWEIFCGKSSNLAADQHCYWTGFLNSYDDMLAFNCPGNRVITGMQSQHNNGAEDRQFKFRCCAVSGRKPSNCEVTHYANGWDAAMDFTIPSNKVLTGAFSLHSNSKEDRRWKFMLCDI